MNWYGVQAIHRFETARWFRTIDQSLFSPVLSRKNREYAPRTRRSRDPGSIAAANAVRSVFAPRMGPGSRALRALGRGTSLSLRWGSSA